MVLRIFQILERRYFVYHFIPQSPYRVQSRSCLALLSLRRQRRREICCSALDAEFYPPFIKRRQVNRKSGFVRVQRNWPYGPGFIGNVVRVTIRRPSCVGIHAPRATTTVRRRAPIVPLAVYRTRYADDRPIGICLLGYIDWRIVSHCYITFSAPPEPEAPPEGMLTVIASEPS